MWSYLLFLLLLGVTIRADNNDDNKDPRYFHQVLNDNLKRKCQTKGDDVLKTYESAMQNFDECGKELMQNVDRDEGAYLSAMVCNNCMKNIIDDVMKCLDPQERFLKDLFYTETLELCQEDGKLFKDTITVINATCPPYTITWAPYVFHNSCMSNLLFMHHKSEPDFMITMSDVCSDLKTSYNCIYSGDTSDPCQEKIGELMAGIFGPYFKWCENKLPETNVVE